MPSFHVYEGLLDSFQMVKLHLTSGLKQQSLGNFSSPPRFYTLTCGGDKKRKEPGGEDRKKKDGGNKKPRLAQTETGWLRYTGYKKFPDLPVLRNNCRLCKEYVTIGLSCSSSNLARCRYGVHVAYKQLSREDKGIIDLYCSKSRSLTLALEG